MSRRSAVLLCAAWSGCLCEEIGRLSVATWNLADLEEAGTTEIATTLRDLGADIVFTQEDIEFLPNASHNELSISGYKRAAYCRAEELWIDMVQYPRGGRWLKNALYVRSDRVAVLHTFQKQICPSLELCKETPRCAVFADIEILDAAGRRIPGTTLRVGSVHLTGGRFADMNWKKFSGTKAAEVENIVKENPRICAGDLNSFPDEASVKLYQASYEAWLKAQKENQSEGYLQWSTEGVSTFLASGYNRVLTDPAKSTTKYGGTVDHIFWRVGDALDTDIAFVNGSARVRGDFTQSDHNIVTAEFAIFGKPPDDRLAFRASLGCLTI